MNSDAWQTRACSCRSAGVFSGRFIAARRRSVPAGMESRVTKGSVKIIFHFRLSLRL